MRSPIDGVVTANAAMIGAPVQQQEALFVIEAHPLDTRLRAELEAIVPERRYDDVQIGDAVHLKLLGNRRKLPGTIQAVRGQSAVVSHASLAAWLTPHRTREAMTVSVAVDPEALHQLAQGVCQIGRSAKVYFDNKSDGGVGGQRLASFTGFVSSAYAAIVPFAR